MEDTKPSTTGAWLLSVSQPYLVDRGLISGLADFLGNASVVEFGAGMGCYSDQLLLGGVDAHAFEGATNVASLTHGFVQHADLTTVGLDVGLRAAWVLCLEVAEHVPKVHEATFLAALDRHNTEGIIMSWSSMRSGVGHVNYQFAAYVLRVMNALNYTEDMEAGSKLRHAVTTYSWFRSTSNRHGRGGGVRVWRRSPPLLTKF